MSPFSGGSTRAAAWLLDVDDTLLDTAAAMRAAAPASVRELDESLYDSAAASVGSWYCTDPEQVFRRFARGELSLQASRGERLRVAYDLAEVQLPPEAEDITAWGARFDAAFTRRFLAQQRVFADVEPALARALGSGIRVGLLTNASESLTRAKLRATRLAGFSFVCVVTRDTLGYGKPDPRVFQHAARLLAPEAQLADVLYVGDELDVDVEAAACAGLRGVLLDRKGARGDVDVPVVRSLGELLPSPHPA